MSDLRRKSEIVLSAGIITKRTIVTLPRMIIIHIKRSRLLHLRSIHDALY